jgi:phosphoglycolate phosphatase-like HAD superfamily hydrolase
MIKAVIFDLDGTLGNTLPLCIEAFRRSVEPLSGKKLSDEEIVATFGPSEEGTILALIPDQYEKGIASYLSYYQQLHDMCPEPFDGIPDLINELKDDGVRLAMVTGKGIHSTRITLDYFGLGSFFEIVETGHLAGPRKTEGIRSVLAHFSECNASDVWYVGDAPSDVLACREAGIPIAAAAWAETAHPEKLAETNPDALFYTVQDFQLWIRKENQ